VKLNLDGPPQYEHFVDFINKILHYLIIVIFINYCISNQVFLKLALNTLFFIIRIALTGGPNLNVDPGHATGSSYSVPR